MKKAFLFSHGTYSDQAMKKTSDALKQLYIDNGFGNVTVQGKVEDFEPEVDVTFVISEGAQDHVAALKSGGQ